jgi:ribosome-associated protein
MQSMKTVEIKTEYIALGQFLKLADCISTGGQAKSFLEETEIKVNGEAENRRGKKLYSDFIVDVEGFGQFKVVRI